MKLTAADQAVFDRMKELGAAVATDYIFFGHDNPVYLLAEDFDDAWLTVCFRPEGCFELINKWSFKNYQVVRTSSPTEALETINRWVNEVTAAAKE
jgi:hypothetical protein